MAFFREQEAVFQAEKATEMETGWPAPWLARMQAKKRAWWRGPVAYRVARRAG